MNGRMAKKIRREVKRTQMSLASDLKTWINELPLGQRIYVAFKILVKGKW
jgi:hypothetical protein